MKKLIFLLLLIMQCNLFSNELKIQTEIDFLPYATGGSYLSLIATKSYHRFRYIYANANNPDFIIPDNFDKWNLKVNAIIYDYFLNRKNTSEWWIGIGFEKWDNYVKSDDKFDRTFRQNVFTIGSGYVYELKNNWFINPWFAGHFNIDSKKDVKVGNDTFKIKKFLPEISVKIGYKF